MIINLMIALAISIDSFCIGVAYGIKKVNIPLPSVLIISCMTLVSLSLSMLIGHIISSFIPSFISNAISFLILFCIGSYMLINALISDKYNHSKTRDLLLLKVTIKSLGIAIQILKEPLKADIDISGVIDTKEAIFLGLALALDALGVGLGVSMGSINYLSILVITGILSILLIKTGLYIGDRYKPSNKFKAAYIPGFLLIIISIFRVIF